MNASARRRSRREQELLTEGRRAKDLKRQLDELWERLEERNEELDRRNQKNCELETIIQGLNERAEHQSKMVALKISELDKANTEVKRLLDLANARQEQANSFREDKNQLDVVRQVCQLHGWDLSMPVEEWVAKALKGERDVSKLRRQKQRQTQDIAELKRELNRVRRENQQLKSTLDFIKKVEKKS